MGIGAEILIVLLLILLSGFFVMAETAVITSRRARLQHQSDEGDKKATEAMKLTDNLNRFLSTVQIGITLIGILTGAVGGAALADPLTAYLAGVPALAPYAASISLVVVVIVITYFSILLGELLPKRLGLQSAERIAGGVAGIMKVISTIFSPGVWLLDKSTNLLLHLFGIKHTDEPPVTEEELLVQLDQGTQAGVFEAAEQEMVEGVFSLSDQRVNALMTPRNEIVWLDVTDTLAEIRKKMAESQFSRFPVASEGLDHLLGVVKAKDVLLADVKSGQDLESLVKPPIYIPETALGSRALETFRETKRDIILVVDEFGVVQGLITLADILEEIVGEFEGKPMATQRQDGSWLLDGMLSNDDFKDIFNLRRLPAEEEYETLGGYIMTHLGRIPQPGDQFESIGLNFEVMDMDGNRVDKVLVTTIPVKSSDDKPA
jgi:putative hemolysin